MPLIPLLERPEYATRLIDFENVSSSLNYLDYMSIVIVFTGRDVAVKKPSRESWHNKNYDAGVDVAPNSSG